MKFQCRYASLALILTLTLLLLKSNFEKFTFGRDARSKFHSRSEDGRKRPSYDENEEPLGPGLDLGFAASNNDPELREVDIFNDVRQKEAERLQEEARQKWESERKTQLAEEDLIFQLQLLTKSRSAVDRNKTFSTFGRLFDINDLDISDSLADGSNSNNNKVSRKASRKVQIPAPGQLQQMPPAKPDHALLFKNFKSAFTNSVTTPKGRQSSSKSSTHPAHESKHNQNQGGKERFATCTMETCFDKNRCRNHPSNDLSVYIYEEAFQNIKYKKSSTGTNWSLYDRIVYVMKQSKFYTADPENACLFLVPFDTLVRDPLDDEYFLRNLSEKIWNLPYWNNGRNHIIFNLYSGTWPAYKEDLQFDFGQAILAKASFSDDFYRHGFDISLPLFKQEQTQFKGSENIFTQVQNNQNSGQQNLFLNANLSKKKHLKIEPLYPASRKYLLTFKGKRYLTGIGSETRNLLYHIHNPEDGVVMLTTCKHGRDWEQYADQRCDQDNRLYETYDYDELLGNATFCLVPRGRRLGSFRFLESLRASCIPVVMANGWVLPFAEVIDWSSALVNFDERHRFQAPIRLRNFPEDQIFEMRQQGIFLYHAYFSSLEKIILTTLEIIRERVFPQFKKPAWIWNNGNGVVGALGVNSDWSKNYDIDYPIYFDTAKLTSTSSSESSSGLSRARNFENNHLKNLGKFTAVIQVITPDLDMLRQVLKTLENTGSCGQVILVMNIQLKDDSIFTNMVRHHRKAEIIKMQQLNLMEDIGAKFSSVVLSKAKYNCVLSLDDDVIIISDELDFGFSVWKSTPERIVGFPNRLHYWLEGNMPDAVGNLQKITRWAYTSKFHNDYSLILTGAAFIHVSYLESYGASSNIGGHSISRSIVEKYKNCEDILLNFVVASMTGQPPLKITQRKRYKAAGSAADDTKKAEFIRNQVVSAPLIPRWTEKAHFQERQICMNKFVEDFGYMPLVGSQHRLDPTLYLDNVAAWRKEFKSIEVVAVE